MKTTGANDNAAANEDDTTNDDDAADNSRCVIREPDGAADLEAVGLTSFVPLGLPASPGTIFVQ